MPTRRDRGVAAHLLFSDRKAIARWHQHAPEHAESARVFEVCPSRVEPRRSKNPQRVPARRSHARELRFQGIYFVSNIFVPAPLNARRTPRGWLLINERG